MRTLTEHVARYAAYHRDPRNVASHFLGIPMIVLAVEVLLARPVVALGAYDASPAWVAVAAASLYYLRLDLRLGAAMAALLACGLAFAGWAASQATGTWLAIGAGGFAAGWAIQFVGHAFEGRKPAFLDDLAGLVIGPIFIVAEAAFAFGWRSDLRDAVQAAGARGLAETRNS
jgi:uncharacterized membrane protein YGL010W